MRKVTLIVLLFILKVSVIAQTQTEKINLLILTQKYSEALSLSNELIRAYPDSAHYYYQNAIIQKLLYRYPQASKSIEKALSLNPENIDYLVEHGILLDKKDDEKKTLEVFKKVFEMNNHQFYAGIWLSNYYLKTKKHDIALDILNVLFENDTINSYLARNIGLCWYKKGDSKNSKYWFSKAIRLDSTDIKAYKYLFSTYAAKEEYDKAFEIIDKAISINTKDKTLHILKGDLHVIRNHHYRAIPAYLDAFNIDKKDEEITRKLGLSYYKIKKYEESKKFLLLADKESMNLDVYKHLGYIYKLQNQPDSSTRYFNKALDILRTDNNTIFNIYVDIAENYLNLELYNHSVGWYEKALDLELSGIWAKNDKNRVLIDLASVYSDKLKDKHKAIACLEKVSGDNMFLLNKEDYYTYAQKEITRLKEELFFEGKL